MSDKGKIMVRKENGFPKLRIGEHEDRKATYLVSEGKTHYEISFIYSCLLCSAEVSVNNLSWSITFYKSMDNGWGSTFFCLGLWYCTQCFLAINGIQHIPCELLNMADGWT